MRGLAPSSTSPCVSSRRALLLHACSGRRRIPAGLSDNPYSKYDFDTQSTQPFEPILFLKLRIYLPTSLIYIALLTKDSPPWILAAVMSTTWRKNHFSKWIFKSRPEHTKSCKSAALSGH
jgi:hypothetical protein